MAAPYGLPRRLRNALPFLLAVLLAMVPAAKAAQVRLLILGDSLTAGYGLPHDQGFQAQLAAALRAGGHDVRIVDAAVSGDTSAGGRARLDWALSADGDAKGADAAIVELGANDGLRGLDPAEMHANLAAILDALGRRPGLLYDPFFLQGVAAVPSLNQPDRIHPNAEGVRRIVGRLLPMVETLLTEAGPA